MYWCQVHVENQFVLEVELHISKVTYWKPLGIPLKVMLPLLHQKNALPLTV